MKKWMIVSLLLFITYSSQAQQKKRISVFELDINRGLYYQPNTIKPYSGTAFEEHPNGKKKTEIPIKDGKIHGTAREWAKNGKKIFEAHYEKGTQVGKETQWYLVGNKKLEVNYVNGQPEGLVTEWYKNEQKKSEGIFQNGKEEGEHKWWFDNGDIDQMIPYKNGKAEGTVKNWFRGGQIKLESNYQIGQQHGLTTEWYESGQKKSEESFVNGTENEKALLWSKTGQLIKEKIYDHGKLIADKNYLSGSIYQGDGYLQVFNEMHDFFTLKISGTTAGPREGDEITYAVDGNLMQIFNYPISLIDEELFSQKKETELLEKFIQKETNYISKATGSVIKLKQENLKMPSGKNYTYWHFVSPNSQTKDQNTRTVLEEYYVSFICGNRILSLYSVVTRKDQEENIKKLLFRTAESLQIEKERIDLNAILSSLPKTK